MHNHHHGLPHFEASRAERLNDPRRLQQQLSEADLTRLLALRGDEDLLDLGSGTGFYTDRMAALTAGIVFAVEIQPEIGDLHRARGVPANVRLVAGDVTQLSLPDRIVDVACCISTYHETDGRLDLPALARILRPGGRLIIIDWRTDPESWEGGPPAELRFSAEKVAESLKPYFEAIHTENLGRFMYAVTGRLKE